MHSQPLTGVIADLCVGDEVLSLPGTGVTFGRGNGPENPPVLVCDTTPGDADLVHLSTSNGPFSIPGTMAVTYLRENTLRPDTALLLSRRVSLHATLLSYGIPLIRRSPVAGDQSAPKMTGREWGNAPIVFIDGYLSFATLRAFTERDDIQARPNIVMLGDDPDDARIYTRAALLGGLTVAVLPYDIAVVMALLQETSPSIHLPQAVTQLIANPARQAGVEARF